ncbi:MAG: beta-galactosidase, partial [Duncaniella sp.]|nr:beta-galactosidase [Duncaniella sp.]
PPLFFFNAPATTETSSRQIVGSFSWGTALTTRNLPTGATLTAGIEGKEPQSVPLRNLAEQDLTFKWDNIKPWDTEHPNMYTLTLALADKKGNILHTHTEKVGFRTLEFIPRDGFYLNGTKLTFKGVNRHCFYPETGRTTSKSLDAYDIKLLKGMNANAIRSHYPPDRHLLELCDSLGVLYFDELPGWHDAYDTKVGTKILTEMLTHDANHPCVFAWGNGNEGGNNYELIPLFSRLDIQNRLVVHPWALANGIDTHHYPAYQTGVGRLANGYEVFMPTEFLHSQYDKGGGASLDDFWNNYSRNPLFAGGFIWAMVDEGVMRTDRNGDIDTDGGSAPDGIVGPHREKEGSWYTIRDVWSPIQIAPVTVRRGR